MKRKKSFFGFSVLFIFLYATMTFTSFATVSADVIRIAGDWQGSVFGDVGGQDKITYENFEITENDDQTVRLRSSNNRGKIASSSEGIAYYFKEIPADANFELTAKAHVESFAMNNQVSFGLMIRDKVLHNESKKEDLGNYLAVGPIDATKEPAKIAFYRIGADSLVKLGELRNEPVPAAGCVYDLSIKKSGTTYILTFGKEEAVVIEDFTSFIGDTIFAGFFTSRNTTVVFSNYDLKVDTRKVTRLKVDSALMKKEYLPGEDLDVTGLTVTAVYSDGSEEALSADDYIVTGFDSSRVGANTVTINYQGVVDHVDLRIRPLTCTKLEIKYFPVKTDYYPGDKFDPEGLRIVAIYNDGYKVEELAADKYIIFVFGESITDKEYIFKTAGVKSVTVKSIETPETYTTFTVTVKNASLTGLEIRRLPEKTLYFIGDELDLDGMVLYAKYSDHNEVRLMRDEYAVSAFDTTTPGKKEVIITYKGEKAILKLKVKEKKAVGLEVTGYPKTTYYLGEELDLTGLEVSKIYDNMDKEILAADSYQIDTSAFDHRKVGAYDLVVVPNDPTIKPAAFKVTVREYPGYEWKGVVFGQSTSDKKNYANIREDGTIELVALEGGGKVARDHDGITFYYTEIDAAKDNFVLSADIKVIDYAKKPHDGQESFGIMARDAVGKDGDASVFASNMVAIGGYSGGTKNPNGTQLFIRTGVKSPDGAGSQGVQRIMIKEEKPEASNTYPAAKYRLTLAKTNSGYTGKLNDGEEVIFFAPEILNVQDRKGYVGFFTARLAKIEVSNIKFTVTAAETDAPRVAPPAEPVTPEFKFVSLDKTSKADYELMVRSNINGTVTIKQGREIIAKDTAVTAGKIVVVPTTIGKNSKTDFSATFLPDDTQLLTSYDRIISNFSVRMRTYVEGGDIYVSPNGASDGLGTVESPLDLDTAIDFVREGQKIIMLEGVYARSSSLVIKEYNNGTAGQRKYLTAAPGTRPVIDFQKKSEGAVLSGDYWHIYGIDFARSAGNTKGFVVGGSHNVIENCRFYENGDTGLQISRTDEAINIAAWPSYNLILNCTSFANRDPSENNADGFAAKLTSGVGNVFRGCIAHNNIDDGWDLYTKAGLGAIGAVLIEGCIAYNNGFLTDGTVGRGDKNGFKLGGEGIHVPHIIRKSMAFGNGAAGFTSNSNPGVILLNNIAYNNGRNLNLSTYPNIVADFTLERFVSYQKEKKAEDIYPEELNSDRNYLFNGSVSQNKSGVRLTDDNFLSLEPVTTFARDAEGNIIYGDFLKFINAPLKE